MPIDRVAALKNADALLQQGRLAQAIAEYTSVVDNLPRDVHGVAEITVRLPARAAAAAKGNDGSEQ